MTDRRPDASARSVGEPDDDLRLRLERLEWLAGRMDTAFRVPGTSLRIGFDSLLGLVPGIGDVLAFLPAAYILEMSRRMGVPRRLLLRMGTNVVVDLAVGAIPILGDIFDVGFKANRRNVRLLRDHFAREGRVAPPPRD